MIAFIDEYRGRFGVEFICKTLNRERLGGFITSRGYRDAKTRPPSARSVRDQELVELVRRVHAANYSVYGIRKMWRALERHGVSIGRDQTARLMRLAGVCGKAKGRGLVTTRKSKREDTRPDLVCRHFRADGPNKLWVADITYVRVKCSFVYTAFVTDVFSRKIVGWAVSETMTTGALPLQALHQSITTAKGSLEDLIHHSDHGAQYVSIAYGTTLQDAGIKSSTGTVGDSYDNALAENVNGSYKNELIHAQTWEDVFEVETATLEWVDWWNNARLHENLDYQTPTETEALYWKSQTTTKTSKHKAKA